MTRVTKNTKPKVAKIEKIAEPKTVEKLVKPKEPVKPSVATLFSDIDVGKLTFTPMKQSMHQCKSYVNLKGGADCPPADCIIITPEIELTIGGIPREHELGYDRNRIVVPTDGDDEFEKLLESIDEAVLENSGTIFGKTINMSTKTHIPIVKLKEPKYFTPKLRVDYNSKNIMTKLFVKGKPTAASTIDEIAKHVTWGSTIQMVILVEKVWANNAVFLDEESASGQQPQTFGVIPADNKEAKFGVSLVVLQVNVVKEKEPSPRSKTLDAFYNSNTFGNH